MLADVVLVVDHVAVGVVDIAKQSWNHICNVLLSSTPVQPNSLSLLTRLYNTLCSQSEVKLSIVAFAFLRG